METLRSVETARAATVFGAPVTQNAMNARLTSAQPSLAGESNPATRLYNDTVFQNPAPGTSARTMLAASPQMYATACSNPTFQATLTEDPLKAHLTRVFAQKYGRMPEATDMTAEFLAYASEVACNGDQADAATCASASYQYGKALAGMNYAKPTPPSQMCGIVVGQPANMMLAENAAIVQGVNATVGALRGVDATATRNAQAVESAQAASAMAVNDAYRALHSA